MKKVRWIGIILIMVLLLVSTGSIFAQEVKVKPIAPEQSLKELLEKKIHCEVYKDQVSFCLSGLYGLRDIYSDYNLEFVPKSFTLTKLDWRFGTVGLYEVKVALGEIRLEIPVIMIERDSQQFTEVLIHKVVDVRAKVYLKKRFDTMQEAETYINRLMNVMEDETKFHDKAGWLMLRGRVHFRKIDFLLRSRCAEKECYPYYDLEIVFME